MKALGGIAMVLVVVGAINWGLVGIGMLAGANYNLVNLIFGSMPVLEAVVYLLVGVSGILVGWVHATGKCAMK
jgi:hypothetical protein